MKWKRKKTYGNYKTSNCPFCERLATSKNEQGLDVCHKHKNKLLDEIKCVCGSWLESRSGKFGPYFNCLNCGNVNYNKAMEMKSMMKSGEDPASRLKVQKKETISEETTNSQNSVTRIKTVVKDDFLTMMKKERLKKFNEEKEKTISTNDFEYFS